MWNVARLVGHLTLEKMLAGGNKINDYVIHILRQLLASFHVSTWIVIVQENAIFQSLERWQGDS